MNKIHNNLNIENLIKTEWFEQFNKEQQEEITRGIQDNLDVSIYANLKYSWEQMQEIREGLKDKVNVSIYAKPELDWKEMGKIRLDLEDNKKREQ